MWNIVFLRQICVDKSLEYESIAECPEWDEQYNIWKNTTKPICSYIEGHIKTNYAIASILAEYGTLEEIARFCELN